MVAEDVAGTFRTDGAAALRRLLDPSWIEALRLRIANTRVIRPSSTTNVIAVSC